MFVGVRVGVQSHVYGRSNAILHPAFVSQARTKFLGDEDLKWPKATKSFFITCQLMGTEEKNPRRPMTERREEKKTQSFQSPNPPKNSYGSHWVLFDGQ